MYELALLCAYICTGIFFAVFLKQLEDYIARLTRVINSIMQYIGRNPEISMEVKTELNEIYMGLTEIYKIELEDEQPNKNS